MGWGIIRKPVPKASSQSAATKTCEEGPSFQVGGAACHGVAASRNGFAADTLRGSTTPRVQGERGDPYVAGGVTQRRGPKESTRNHMGTTQNVQVGRAYRCAGSDYFQRQKTHDVDAWKNDLARLHVSKHSIRQSGINFWRNKGMPLEELQLITLHTSLPSLKRLHRNLARLLSIHCSGREDLGGKRQSESRRRTSGWGSTLEFNGFLNSSELDASSSQSFDGKS